MIDSDELLVEFCGDNDVAAFKRVKKTSMRLAHVVKQVIADDLGGTLPSSGKQFLQTGKGTWRLAARANSDNTTEVRANKRLGASQVQVFGDLTQYRRDKGWITVEDLYGIHGVRFDSRRMLRKVERQLKPSKS